VPPNTVPSFANQPPDKPLARRRYVFAWQQAPPPPVAPLIKTRVLTAFDKLIRQNCLRLSKRQPQKIQPGSRVGIFLFAFRFFAPKWANPEYISWQALAAAQSFL
jgi:hypothetical protein